MAVLLRDVGRCGSLDVTFTRRRGKTAIRHAYCEVPFKITRLYDSSPFGLPHVILMHCTAGVFGGDVLHTTIHVEAGACVAITQQSATKVHPSRHEFAVQRNRIRVDAGAELHMYCEPVIPFAGSRLHQTTSIDVEPGARLWYWESLMAGRVGSGEVWQLDELCSETCLRLNGRPVYLDRLRLKPEETSPAGEWMMGEARYLATGLCFHEHAGLLAARLPDVMPDAGIDMPASGLVAVRVLSGNGPDFRCSQSTFSSAARALPF